MKTLLCVLSIVVVCGCSTSGPRNYGGQGWFAGDIGPCDDACMDGMNRVATTTVFYPAYPPPPPVVVVPRNEVQRIYPGGIIGPDPFAIQNLYPRY